MSRKPDYIEPDDMFPEHTRDDLIDRIMELEAELKGARREIAELKSDLDFYE